MGKTVDLTPSQRAFINIISKEPYFSRTFYLTGGTALSAFYYHHRLSEDIDLFTGHPFDQTYIQSWMLDGKKRNGWNYIYTQVFERQNYEITWKKFRVKVDFVFYDFKQIEVSKLSYQGITIDTLGDIAVNKLLTISQRTAAKDFVDLYFLLNKDYTYWDLMHGVAHKFGMEIEPVYLSSLFLKVEELDVLPVMKKKLTLDALKRFFRAQAKQLGSTMVKP